MSLIEKFNDLFKSHQASCIFIAIDDTDKKILAAQIIQIPWEHIAVVDNVESYVLFECQNESFEKFKEVVLSKYQNAINQDKRRFIRYDIEDNNTIPQQNKLSAIDYVENLFLPFAEEAQMIPCRDITFLEEINERRALKKNDSLLKKPSEPLKICANLSYFLSSIRLLKPDTSKGNHNTIKK